MSKWFFAAAAWALLAGTAQAQIYVRPVAPNPPPATGTYIPQPTPGGTVLLPVYTPPPSQYKTFYGPSIETVGVMSATSYYRQPGVCGDRTLRSSTVLVPIYGYTPGYYSGYDTPRFFRP
jgi:hypothetical protein